jgi:hypothetical protein
MSLPDKKKRNNTLKLLIIKLTRAIVPVNCSWTSIVGPNWIVSRRAEGTPAVFSIGCIVSALAGFERVSLIRLCF